MDADPALVRLVDRVVEAARNGTRLEILGSGSKRFYGETPHGEPLVVRELAGISAYEPSELVVTVRAGTRLDELEATLAEHRQYLAFEPPHFNGPATIGGMIAAGLAGPARASVGSVRDFILGATLLNGRGEVLTFGGQVMKNVAGYDISRVLAGSLGIFGVICEVSLKVLPIPAATHTISLECSQADAIRRTNDWIASSLPINATAWHDGRLYLRLRGANAAIDAALGRIGGESVSAREAEQFWRDLRDHQNAFFASSESRQPLWRLSVPPTTAPLELNAIPLIEWHGGLRWYRTDSDAATIRGAAARAGGHATLFYAEDKSAGVFTPLASPLLQIHRELKKAFDPKGIFNHGRMLKEL